MSDMVNRPDHYCKGRQYEPLNVISDWDLNYRLGSALKYISRAGRKQDAAEDLRKAVFYLEREIAALEGEQGPYTAAYEDVLKDAVEDASVYGFDTATETDWLSFWDEVDSCNTFSLWDDSLGPTELTEEEIEEILEKKDLKQFSGDEIVSLIEKRGFVLGVKRDGSTCILNDQGACQ